MRTQNSRFLVGPLVVDATYFHEHAMRDMGLGETCEAVKARW